MISIPAILSLHEETVRLWHVAPITNPYSGFLSVVCQQHAFNFELWHQEDLARSPTATNEEIAQVKRAIDRLNQSRNDWIEKLDDAISELLQSVSVRDGALQNTETVGSAIDRLSIMALRIYHYDEQVNRQDADAAHRAKVMSRSVVCREQQRDLATALEQLVDDLVQGKKRHKTYRQMKMYNDPTLNPLLYGAAGASTKRN